MEAKEHLDSSGSSWPAAPRGLSPLARLAAKWRHWQLWRRQLKGGAAVLNALYERRDPWKLASEQARFAATNDLIRARCPAAATILEVGCGEGLQTRYLTDIAVHVTGIDISETAVARAREAVPGATFLAGDLHALLPRLPHPRYDVATLCEVLYYMPDPDGALAALQSVADHVVVTVYKPLAPRFDALLTRRGFVSGPMIRDRRKRWTTFLWTGPGNNRTDHS